MSESPDMTELDDLLAVARSAVDEVTERVIRPARTAAPRARVQRKAEGDFVTEVDLAAETRLRELLLAARPDYGFLGEEHPPSRLDADRVWIVDPIDGTSNFAQGLGHFAVSVACLERGDPLVGVTHCFPEGVTWTAVRGAGTRRDGEPVRAPDVALDDAAVLGINWFRGAFEPEWMAGVFRCGARLRNHGSTVTQLCDVAAGRLHGNVQVQGRPWDFAAAGLIAAEAGCRVTDWSGKPLFPLPLPGLGAQDHHPSVIAPPRVHDRLLALLPPSAPIVSNG